MSGTANACENDMASAISTLKLLFSRRCDTLRAQWGGVALDGGAAGNQPLQRFRLGDPSLPSPE